MRKRPPFARRHLSQAILMACIAAANSTAMAGSGSCTNGSNVIGLAATDTCYLETGDSLKINSTGSIIPGGSDSGVWAEGAAVLGGISNAGTIDVGGHGIYVYGNVSGGIVNSGLISAGWMGIYVYGASSISKIENSGTIESGNSGIYVYGSGGTATVGSIDNSGLILADDKGIYLYNVSVSGDITNSGTIDAGDSGLYIYGSTVGGDITNSGTIISSSEAGIYIYGTTVEGDIINSGTIDANNHGIYVFGSTVGDITNSGLIIAGDHGIYVYGTTGNITNSGTIVTDEAGIYVYGSTTGAIENSGTIAADYRGIYVYNSTVNGGVLNSGVITSGYAGVYVFGGSVITGIINNSGTIDTDGKGLYVYGSTLGGIDNSGTIAADEYGIYIHSSTISGSIINSGLISGDAGIYIYGATIGGDIDNSGTIYALEYGDGIYVYNSTVGNITNSGLIDADYHGIYVYDSTAADITNSGTIYAGDHGIYVYGDVGNITNSGTIVSDEAGFYIYGSTTGTIENSGTIVSDDGYRGIYVYGSTVNGDIINSGTIDAGDAGIYVHGSTISGNISNSGSISADDGHGIYVYGTVDGDITNSGTIVADEIGIYVFNSSSVGGSISNSGTITAGARGMYLYGSIGGDVANSGTINATDYQGVYIYGSTVGGDVANSGTITGGYEGLYIYGTTVGGDVTNSGTIVSGDGYAALAIESNSTVSGDVINTGALMGGLYVNVSNTVTNSGLVYSRGYNSYVNGDYTQTAGGTFRFGATDDTTFDTFGVDGTATFAAGSGISVAAVAGNTLADGDVMNAVISAGTLDATTFTVTDNLLALSFTADIDGDTVDITAADTGLTTVDAAVDDAGFDAGSEAAAVLDYLIGLDPESEFAFAVGSADTAQGVASAVESLLPALSGGVAKAMLDIGDTVTTVVGSHQDAMNGLSSGDEYLANRHVWLKPFAGWTDQGERDGVSGYKVDGYGLAVGVDGDTSDTWSAGAALAYVSSDVDSDVSAGTQTIGVDTYFGKIYATHKLDEATAINLQAGYGVSSNDSERDVPGAVASAEYDSSHIQASAEVLRNYATDDKTNVAPYARVSYSYVDVDGYSEKGAGVFNLTVGDDSEDSLVIGGGVRGTHAASDKLTLMGDVGIGFDAMAGESDVTASFAGGGSQFTSKGIDQSKVVYNLGLGAKYSLDNGSDLTASYDFDGRSSYTDHVLSLKLNMKF